MAVVKKVEGRLSLFVVQAYATLDEFNAGVKEKLLTKSSFFYKHGYIWWLGDENDYLRARKWFTGKMNSSEQWAPSFFADRLAIEESFVSSLESELEKVSKFSGEELVQFARDFIKKAAQTTSLAYFTDWVSFEANKWIYDYIDHSQLSDEQFRALVGSNLISFGKEYEYSLARVKLGHDLTPIENIAQQFSWVQDNYQYVGRVNVEKVQADFTAMTKEEAEAVIHFVEKELPGQAVSRKEEIAKLPLDTFQKQLLTMLGNFVDLQDKRKACVFVTNTVLFPLLHKILDYKGCTNEEDRALIMQSAYPLWIVEKNLDELLALARKANEGLYQEVDKEPVFGEEAEKIYTDITGQDQGEVKELRGFIANVGKATGKVVIINRISDFEKFKEGDILVSSMTRPEMIPIMKMAAAFVTDEGGITCHAAIVAREMKKPCVIATKIATQVLKDGDMVEVDAEKGIVRIIKKA